MSECVVDRIGVCEVYYLLELYYNVGGILHERPLNARRRAHMESIHWQLHRMGFRPSPLLSYDSLDDAGREYFDHLIEAWGLPPY